MQGTANMQPRFEDQEYVISRTFVELADKRKPAPRSSSWPPTRYEAHLEIPIPAQARAQKGAQRSAEPERRAEPSRASRSSMPGPTTVMIRGLPIRANVLQIFDHLDLLGFKGKYDYVHFPVDIRTRMHTGYAFVNFVTASAAQQCTDRIAGTQLKGTSSRKIITANAATHQGVKANLHALGACSKARRKAAELPWLLERGEMLPIQESSTPLK